MTINGGYVMPAWYDILGLDSSAIREDEAGLRASQAQVEALIAREKDRGVPADRIVLAGFSQGCAMTLMTGLRHGERLAGLVGLSGYLPLAAKAEAERHATNRDTPIFLAHGRMDPVIPIARAIASRDALKALGHPVEWHEYPATLVCAGDRDLERGCSACWRYASPQSRRGHVTIAPSTTTRGGRPIRLRPDAQSARLDLREAQDGTGSRTADAIATPSR